MSDIRQPLKKIIATAQGVAYTGLAAAIDGYFEAFFMVLTPRGKP